MQVSPDYKEILKHLDRVRSMRGRDCQMANQAAVAASRTTWTPQDGAEVLCAFVAHVLCLVNRVCSADQDFFRNRFRPELMARWGQTRTQR